MSSRIPTAILLLTCLLATGRSATGQEKPGTEKTSSAPPEQILVMSDGRILRGQMHRHAAGYYVERPSGSILIPSDQIRCVARDLKDAYHQQREQMIEPTSAMLIRLAEWCVTYRLYDEATDELKRALRRDPENEVARRMLGRLNDMLRADPVKTLSASRVDTTGVFAADVEALGGLSRKSAAEFTAKIQPLLINKCGNAGCHGYEATSEFRLSHVRVGSSNHRRAAEQNLATVLKYIDSTNPLSSPLLTETTRGQHGGASFAIFGGASGAMQEKLLKSWVTTITDERRAENERYAARTPLTSAPRVTQVAATESSTGAGQSVPPVESGTTSTIQLASAEIPVVSPPPELLDTAMRTQPVTSLVSPVPQRLPADPAAGQLMNADPLKSAAELHGEDSRDLSDNERSERPVPRFDPFDPEEFNRKYATQRR